MQVITLLTSSSLGTQANAEINLDTLNDCKDIAIVANELKMGTLPTADECKVPIRNLEYHLMQRAGGRQSNLCLLRNTSVDLLSDFACFRYSMPANGEMTCFRRARLKDITAYKQNYERTGAKMAQDYLAAASQCMISNGNSTITPDVVFPRLLTLIAKFEFGFTTHVGQGRATDSIIQHGYARTDPSIISNIPDAIEYISFNISSPKNKSTIDRQQVGKWMIRIKKDEEYDNSVNSAARKKRMRFMMQSNEYILEQQSDIDISMTEKIALLDVIQDNISGLLINEKFTVIKDEDLSQIGMTRKKIIEEADKKLAFGVYKKRKIKIGENILAFFNTSQPGCSAKNSGAIGMYSFLVLPTKDVASDFGSVMLTFIGLDNCSDFSRNDTKDYLENLNEFIRKKIFLTLQSH